MASMPPINDWVNVAAVRSELPVIRPRSEITPYKADLPGFNAPGVRLVIGSLPLTDGARPSRDVKTMIARSIVGAIQTKSRGAHHDRKHGCTTSQQTGRQGCDSPVSGEFSGNGAYRIAEAHQRNQVAGTGNSHGCNARRAARDDSSTRALLGDRIRLAQVRGETERPAAIHHRDRWA